mmetsp:Transcript_29681/g.46346  ORF Transcript_29681/g.46346 Transcript_29681/m.46346 type:complete len:213 (+) Transcript_29681:560-1198(+)
MDMAGSNPPSAFLNMPRSCSCNCKTSSFKLPMHCKFFTLSEMCCLLMRSMSPRRSSDPLPPRGLPRFGSTDRRPFVSFSFALSFLSAGVLALLSAPASTVLGSQESFSTRGLSLPFFFAPSFCRCHSISNATRLQLSSSAFVAVLMDSSAAQRATTAPRTRPSPSTRITCNDAPSDDARSCVCLATCCSANSVTSLVFSRCSAMERHACPAS